MDTPNASSSARDAPSVPLQPDSVVRAALSLRIVLIADQALGGHSQTLAQAVRGPASSGSCPPTPRRGSAVAGGAHRRPIPKSTSRTSSVEGNVVAAADGPAFDDVGIDADIGLIVLRRGTQDAGIFG